MQNFTINFQPLRNDKKNFIGFLDIFLPEISLFGLGVWRPGGELKIYPPCKQLKSGKLMRYFNFSDELYRAILEKVEKEIAELGLFDFQVQKEDENSKISD